MEMPHCVGMEIMDVDPSNDLYRKAQLDKVESYQKGAKAAICTTNQFRDWMKKTNGQWNKWGFKAGYGFPKTKVNRMSQCDPLKPHKCPKDLDTCIKYTVTDADFSNELF